MQFFHSGLQFRNHAVQVARTLLRYWTVAPHIVWIEFSYCNLYKREPHIDRMACRNVRLLRSKRVFGQYLQESSAKPRDVALDRFALHWGDVADITREDALGRSGIQRRFDVAQQLVDMLARDQQALAVARIQRNVILIHLLTA